jgi:hypothetical protein
MRYFKWRKSTYQLKSRGNIESILTILPQVAIFLISLQIVFLYLHRGTSTYLDQRVIARAAVGISDRQDYEYAPLIGGGNLLIMNKSVSQYSLMEIFHPSKLKLLSIVVDETSIE